MYDILGIGNAICDMILQVEDDVLEKYGLAKGTMSLISQQKADRILCDISRDKRQSKVCSGGSVANAIHYLSEYGLKSSFIGNVTEGFYGNKFVSDMFLSGINFHNVGDVHSDESSAKSIVLVTPDGERTMCTYLGCAGRIHDKYVDFDLIKNSNNIYIEGYLYDNEITVTTINKILSLTKENNKKVSFSLSDPLCVTRHKDKFLKLFASHIDIMFGNEAEIKALFDVEEIDEVFCNTIKSVLTKANCSICVITRHDKGCIIIDENDICYVPVERVKPLDSTGAGDAFAAGFLYGYIKGNSLENCGMIANNVASQVVKFLGARPKINLPNIDQVLKQTA